MKSSTQRNLLAGITILLLGVGLFIAITIGDQVKKFQSYKTLLAITRLGKPIHVSIDSLQKERLFTSMYLTRRDPKRYTEIEKQSPLTDKHLKAFADQLKTTQILLLSIPENELQETRQKISSQRKSLNRLASVYKDNKAFYTNVIQDFLVFLDKMYEFADDPEFQPLVKSLIAAELYKEDVSQEILAVSHEVSKPEISPGEIPLLRQMISDQIYFHENLLSATDPEIKKSIQQIEISADKNALTELQKKFEEVIPDLKGSDERSAQYAATGNRYLVRYAELTGNILKRLEKTAKEGRDEFEAKMIKTGLAALIILIFLVGCLIFVQKIEIKE